MLRAFLICLAIAAGSICEVRAQGTACSPLRIDLNSQAEVDNFQNDHGPCNWLQFLTVQGPEILNLEGLSELTRVDFDLTISSTGVASLEGLQNLEVVGEFGISRNSSLTSLDGFPSGLSYLGILGIARNDALTDITALENLTRLGRLFIGDSPALSSFSGLDQVTEIESFDIYNNPSLVAIKGLGGLRHVGNLLVNANASLRNLDGFAGLESAGHINIQSNAALTSLDGLAGVAALDSLTLVYNGSLRTLDGLSGLTTVSYVSVSQNPSLRSLGGLSNLKSIGRNLSVTFNAALPNLDGLTGLESVGFMFDLWGNDRLSNIAGLSSLRSVGQLFVADNPMLADCGPLVTLIDPIDDYEPGPGPGEAGIPDIERSATIQSNLDGCDSINQILGQVPLGRLNSGLNDSWFFRDTAGQGFFIIVFPQREEVFLSWFTYDTERPPEDVTAQLGEPGHRWLTAQGGFEDNVAVLDVYLTAGGIFDAPEPVPDTEPDGEIVLEFTSCNSGTVSYDIASIGRQGEIPVERIVLDNVTRCYLLEHQAESTGLR